ncbi:MAG: hypothetical protein LCH44_13995, partial [Bacteroidetes bacterium]|nr:hypothetical protein [Bacteroidota bacterium]
MKYIFDRVGIDASAGNMLRVPNDDYENFPDPAIHRGGFYYDTEEDRMYYSNGIIWTQVGSGSVTSVNASASGALSVTGGPIVTTGVLNINWTGTSDYLVQGDGTLILKTSIIPVVSPSALTKIDDTNVTLALGGSPASALLQNVSLTLGWNGVLSTTRGGTGLGSLGTANQLLRVNTGATALEYFTPNWTSNTGTVTSIAMSVPPAFTITGSPITTSGTLALGITAGYIIPTTTQVGYWNTISQPNGQITYGNGIGITSNPNLTFDVATYRLSIGVLTGAGTHSLNVGINNTTS